jgi:lysophospholipase L1-like esterase
MRFNEFKIVKEAGETPKFYTIGDSHAVAIAHAGGKDWVNLAIGGRSSTDSQMLANISKLPAGAIVVVSQGANDTANASRSVIDSKGQRKPVPAATIASNVANVVAKVQAQQPAKVYFMLFPNGPGRGAGLAQYYGGDYQEEVRNAIKGAIDVPIIDINGKPLTDGVHATMAVYKEVANKVTAQSGSGVSLGNSTGAPGAPRTKDKAGQGGSPSALTLDVPTGRRGPAVRDVQQALIALGYKLPKHGPDGIRGPETVEAVKAFQQANSLTVDGDPGTETVAALNKLIATKGITITKSTDKDVKSTDYSKGAADLAALASDETVKEGKATADKFLGRDMDEKEWNYLLRATSAEASNNSEEQALVMAVILNRTRSGKWGNSVVSVLMAPNQFQAVTGTSADGHVASPNFTRGPTQRQLTSILTGIKEHLPNAPKDIQRFTAANPAAYGPGTNIGYLHKLKAAGGQQVGGTIFA